MIILPKLRPKIAKAYLKNQTEPLENPPTTCSSYEEHTSKKFTSVQEHHRLVYTLSLESKAKNK